MFWISGHCSSPNQENEIVIRYGHLQGGDWIMTFRYRFIGVRFCSNVVRANQITQPSSFIIAPPSLTKGLCLGNQQNYNWKYYSNAPDWLQNILQERKCLFNPWYNYLCLFMMNHKCSFDMYMIICRNFKIHFCVSSIDKFSTNNLLTSQLHELLEITHRLLLGLLIVYKQFLFSIQWLVFKCSASSCTIQFVFWHIGHTIVFLLPD